MELPSGRRLVRTKLGSPDDGDLRRLAARVSHRCRRQSQLAKAVQQFFGAVAEVAPTPAKANRARSFAAHQESMERSAYDLGLRTSRFLRNARNAFANFVI